MNRSLPISVPLSSPRKIAEFVRFCARVRPALRTRPQRGQVGLPRPVATTQAVYDTGVASHSVAADCKLDTNARYRFVRALEASAGLVLVSDAGGDPHARSNFTVEVGEVRVEGVMQRIASSRASFSGSYADRDQLVRMKVVELKLLVAPGSRPELGAAVMSSHSSAVGSHAPSSPPYAGLERRQDVDPEEVVGLMRASGYVDLCSQAVASRAWASRSPNEPWSEDVVYRGSEGHLWGHVSLTRRHRRGWLMHQLATRGSPRSSLKARKVLHQFLAQAPRRYAADDAAVYAFYNATSAWHRRFLGEFIELWGRPELATELDLDCHHLQPAARGGELGTQPLPEGPGTSAAVLAMVEATYPRVLVQTLDMDRMAGLGLGVAKGSSCTQAHTPAAETREVVTVWRDGELRCAAICDFGPRDGSIFGLFNLAWYVQGEGPVLPRDRARLTWAISQRYAQRDVVAPLMMSPQGLWPGSYRGTAFVEGLKCCVMKGSTLLAWEHFIAYEFDRVSSLGSAASGSSTAGRKSDPGFERHWAPSSLSTKLVVCPTQLRFVSAISPPSSTRNPARTYDLRY